jgi:hypothetical protein
MAREFLEGSAMLKIIALRRAARVSPDDGRAQGAGGFIEADAAVHLPGETYTADSRCVNGSVSDRFAHSGDDCLPPIFGILLRIAGLRLVDWIFLLGAAQGAT